MADFDSSTTNEGTTGEGTARQRENRMMTGLFRDRESAEGAYRSLSSRGYGKARLDWLKAEALRRGCARLQLDSGTWRKDAHAFYLREGLRIEAFHFGIALG